MLSQGIAPKHTVPELLQGQHALQLLQYAAHCYMAGIKLSTANPATTGMKTRNEEALTTSLDLLPRVLHLLSFDDKNGRCHKVLGCIECREMEIKHICTLHITGSIQHETHNVICIPPVIVWVQSD